MSHVCLTSQELQSVEQQLDIFVELFTWFGTAKDITVQEFADAVNVEAREEALLEPLDFEELPNECRGCGASTQGPCIRCSNCVPVDYPDSL